MLFSVFAKPELLLALAAVPALAVFAWVAATRRRQMLARLGNVSTIQAQVVRPGGRVLRGLGWALGLGLLALAAAGPRWGLGPAPPTMPGRDIVLVVDLSRSMLARDALPTRLGRAKEALAEFVDAVQSRGGHRLAIVAFAGRANVVCPLTHDYDHVRTKLAALEADPLPPALQSTGISGTRLGAGIGVAIGLHDSQSRGAQDIVLVSDGDDPTGDDEWRDAYRSARAAGIPVHVVGIGDSANDSAIVVNELPLSFQGQPALTRLHDTPLREIAARTGGTFVSSGVAKPDLPSLLRSAINPSPTREALAGTLPQPVEHHQAFLLAGLGVILLLVLPRLPIAHFVQRAQPVAVACLALLLISAASSSDEALRRGTDALVARRYEDALTQLAAAAERSHDPGLVAFNEGVALFQLGRFREAELKFRCALSDAEGPRLARANYNLGCALVQSSRGLRTEPLKQAIAAFERALATELLEGDEQARARENLDLTKGLLSQLPPEAAASQPLPEPGSDPLPAPAVDPEGSEGGGNKGSPGDRPRNGKPANAPQADRSPAPGKGTLPPLPDEAALAKLTPDDAKAHLEQAANRIAEARRVQLRRTAAMPSAQFPDW